VVFAGEERGGGRTKVALQKERAQIASRGNLARSSKQQNSPKPKGFARFKGPLVIIEVFFKIQQDQDTRHLEK